MTTGTGFLMMALVGLALIAPFVIGSVGLDVLDLGVGQGELSVVFVGLGSGMAVGGASALIALHAFHASMTAAWLAFAVIAVMFAVIVSMLGMKLIKTGSGAGDAVMLDSLKGHEYPLRHSVKAGSLGELCVNDRGSAPFTVWFRAKEPASAGTTVRILGASKESPKQVEAEIIHDEDLYAVLMPAAAVVDEGKSTDVD